MTEVQPTRRWWPSSPHDFVDTTRCPACFTTIVAPTCPECGLLLTDPRMTELLAAGQSIVDAEDRRQGALARVRAAQRSDAAAATNAQAAAERAAWQEERAARVATTGDPIAAVVVGATPPAAPQPGAARPAPGSRAGGASAASDLSASPAAPRRRLTVPVLLLIVGVSLVSVAAIFFLTLAWFFSDIAVRALIIGGVTLATIVIASVLRRRKLTMTAEGIAVLGVVLIGLDVWAVRANDLFGAGAVRPALYAGLGLLFAAIVFRIWARVSGLRAPDFAAVIALPAGVGLLVAGVLDADAMTTVTVGFLGAAVGALAHRLPTPLSTARPTADAVLERTILASIGTGALALAVLSDALTVPGSVWTPVWLAPSVAALAVLHAVAVLRGERLPAARSLAATALAIGAVAVGISGWVMSWRDDAFFLATFLGPVVAVAVAVAAVRLHRMPRFTPLPLVPAVVTAGVIGGVSLVVAVVGWLLRGGDHASSWVTWRTLAFLVPEGDAALWTAAGAVVIAGLLLLLPTGLHRAIAVARPIVVAVVLLAGAFATGASAAPVITAALIAVASVAALARAATPRSGWLIAAALGGLTAYLVGLTHPALWLVGVVVAIALPVALARVLHPTGGSLVAAVAAPVTVAALSTLPAAGALSVVLGRPSDGAATTLLLIQWLAVIVLTLAVFARAGDLVRRTLAVAGTALAAFALLPLLLALLGGGLGIEPGAIPALLDRPIVGVIRIGVLIALLVTLVIDTTAHRAARHTAAALVAPALALVAVVVHALLIGIPAFAATALLPSVTWQMLTPEAAVVVAGAGAVVALAGGLGAYRMPHLSRPRGSADISAAALALLALPWAGSEPPRWWMMFTVLAVGFAAASICRGWRNPLATAHPATNRVGADDAVARAGAVRDPNADDPAGAASGMAAASDGTTDPLTAHPASATGGRFAWRRILIWPVVLFASLAWLRGLHTYAPTAEVETYVAPVAVLLLGFCAVLVWLRRTGEASVAIAASFLTGLVLPAIAGWTDEGLRSTLVALIAAALALALAWSPARRIRAVAAAGATTALAGVLTAVARHIDAAALSELTWLILPVAVAYLAGIGFARGREGQRAHPGMAPSGDTAATSFAFVGGRAPSASVFPLVVPPLVLSVATLMALPSVDQALLLGLTFGTLAVLHLASAGLGHPPFAGASRWTALAAAVVVSLTAVVIGDHRPIELVTFPVAAIALLGTVVAITRHRRPEAELPVWVAGLAAALVPSIVAPLTDLRTWLVIGVGLAVGLVAASVRHPLALATALAASLGAAAMGVRTLATGAPEALPALVAAVGGVLVGAMLIQRRPDLGRVTLTTPIVGIALGCLAAIIGGDGSLWSTALIAATATVVGMAGAWLLAVARWAGFGAVLALGAAATTVLAIARRFVALGPAEALSRTLIGRGSPESIEQVIWPFAALVAIGLIAGVALWRSRDRTVWSVTGMVLAVGTVGLGVGETWALGAQTTTGAQVVVLVTITVLTVAAVTGHLLRARLGVSLVAAGLLSAAGFALAALTMHGVRPVELVTVPPALGLLTIGIRALRSTTSVRSWPALGPGLALLMIPSLLHDIGPTALWRVVALGLVAVAIVVIGAVRRLQSPLVLGSVVLLIHAVAQLWPWIAAAYTAVPWWLWAGLAGILLIVVALRYERQKVALRKAFVTVTSLR